MYSLMTILCGKTKNLQTVQKINICFMNDLYNKSLLNFKYAHLSHTVISFSKIREKADT